LRIYRYLRIDSKTVDAAEADGSCAGNRRHTARRHVLGDAIRHRSGGVMVRVNGVSGRNFISDVPTGDRNYEY